MTARRHAFCRLRPGAVPIALCDGDDAEAVYAWLATGRPAIRRRRQQGESATGVPLGIALPTEQGRRRLGLRASEADVTRCEPPPRLADAAATAPAAWQGALAGIAVDAAREELDVRVYGSLAWQHLTGERYLRAASDLDLAVWIGDAAGLDRTLALFDAWDGAGRMRLDGEVIFPGEAAVNWRELRAGEERVLVKRPDATALEPRAALLTELAAA